MAQDSELLPQALDEGNPVPQLPDLARTEPVTSKLPENSTDYADGIFMDDDPRLQTLSNELQNPSKIAERLVVRRTTRDRSQLVQNVTPSELEKRPLDGASAPAKRQATERPKPSVELSLPDGRYSSTIAQCLLTPFLLPASTEDCVRVQLDYNQETGLVSLSPSEGSEGLLLYHAHRCPARAAAALPPDLLASQYSFSSAWFTASKENRTKVGALVVIEDALTHSVLLTRRQSTMRLFPNVWVGPGGHVDFQEDLAAAAAREVEEELGLRLVPTDLRPYLLYESVYPVTIEGGEPAVHHLIVIFHALIPSKVPQFSLQDVCIKAQATEVGAYAWLDRTQARAAIDSLPALAVACCEVAPDGQVRAATLSTGQLTPSARPDGTYPDERLATGTVVWLRHWLADNK